ncbi:type III secretion system chaperone [Algicola sagamiensis]|uniref:type III secretion system chaperone n=1 Tax=Algicola sagamiensis TaxID=163869 RepID=UPI0003A1C2D2|nr:type III secretion system chaperone [Algicola sagamiensis]
MKSPMNQLLDALAPKLGFEALEFDADGVCILMFDDSLVLELHVNDKSQSLSLTAFIGEISNGPTLPNALKEVLSANISLNQAYGMSLGVEPITNSLLLLQQIHAEQTTIECLDKVFTTYVEQAEYWQEQLIIMNHMHTPPQQKPVDSCVRV